jgi:hypothetical protein
VHGFVTVADRYFPTRRPSSDTYTPSILTKDRWAIYRKWNDEIHAYLSRKYDLKFASIMGFNVKSLSGFVSDGKRIEFANLPYCVQEWEYCIECGKDLNGNTEEHELVLCTVEWDDFEKCYRYDFLHDKCNEAILDSIFTDSSGNEIAFRLTDKGIKDKQLKLSLNIIRQFGYCMNMFSLPPQRKEEPKPEPIAETPKPIYKPDPAYSIICDKCGKEFSGKRKLRAHKKEVHAY